MTHLAIITLAWAALAGTRLTGQAYEMRQFPIVDPVLQMPAWYLTVPAGWKADGTMLPGSSCNSSTSPIYRASSADGSTGMYLLPRTDWAWGSGVRAANDCQRLPEVTSAKDYLTYLTRILKVGIVQEVPVPEIAEARRNLESLNQQAQGAMHWTVDSARFLIRYSIGNRPFEEWLTVDMNCTEKIVLAVGKQYGCSAFVSRWFAPLGKLQAGLPEFRAMKMTLNKPWMDSWTAAMRDRMGALTRTQTDTLLRQGRLAQAQRTTQQQEFMTAMKQGRDIRNQQFVEGQYNKQQRKEDYVDFILDCQRAYSGNLRVSVGNCPNRETP